MATAKQPKVTLSLEDLGVKIDAIKAVDTQLTALRGTIGEWNKKGKDAARSIKFFGTSTLTLEADDLGDLLDQLQSATEAAQQFGNEVAGEWIKSNRTDSDTTSALKEQRAKLVGEAEALRSIFVQMLGEDAVTEFTIPSAPKAGSGGSGVSTKGISFYRVIDGQRTFPGQPYSMSLAAFHWFKCATETLRSRIANQHGKVDETKDWEGEVRVEQDVTKDGQSHVLTIGWVVAAPVAETKADETKSDDEEASK